MRILICGANGQLGLQFKDLYQGNDSFCFATKEECDLRSADSIHECISRFLPSVIINCAAYTDVQGAEHERCKAFELNTDAVGNLAQVCAKRGVRLIHISTDSVFDGVRNGGAYAETDPTGPLNVYSESKLLGEVEVQRFAPSGSAIVRVSWLYSNFGNNFYEKIIAKIDRSEEILVVNDQFSSPSFGGKFVEFLHLLVTSPTWHGVEIFHYGDGGVCSWYDFATEIAHNMNYGGVVIPINTPESGSMLRRPRYTKLSTN